MLEHPIRINRPLVVTDLGTRLCRPSEVVLDTLPLPQLKAFAKEDGEVIIDEQGRTLKIKGETRNAVGLCISVEQEI